MCRPPAFAHNIKWSILLKGYVFDCTHMLTYVYKNEVYFRISFVHVQCTLFEQNSACKWTLRDNVEISWNMFWTWQFREAGWLLDWLTTLVCSPGHGAPTFCRVSDDPWSAAQVCLIGVGAKLFKEKEDNQYYDVKKLNKVKVEKFDS